MILPLILLGLSGSALLGFFVVGPLAVRNFPLAVFVALGYAFVQGMLIAWAGGAL